MPLSPGYRLGPYEILSPLGAGGMGEVYRARDPRLRREVAVKVLPEALSADAERMRRFEVEARAAGALNHPNITVVHDVGSHEGVPYVVSELLEGETLRSVVSRGEVSPKTAIDYAVQIAQGLAAAHEKGIVHRDLKPENLFVLADGRVKILDFGLAKLVPMGAGPEISSLPTETRRTEPGTVMGTLAYMSPEQVKGRPVDARSDIFSFGTVLYEMLSGRGAFHRDTAAETISAILREEPDLPLPNQSVSPGLEKIVRSCMEKAPEKRFRSAHDVALSLEAAAVSAATGPSAPPPNPRRRLLAPPSVAALVVTLAAGVTGGLLWRGAPAPPSYRRLTFGRGPIWSARFAPDGQTVVYSASWEGAQRPQLYSVRLGSTESLRMALPPGRVESISRDGDMLVLDPRQFSTGLARKGTLSRTSLSETPPRDLLEDVACADASADGSQIAVVRAPGWRYRLEFPAGTTLDETTGWFTWPRVSRNGDTVAFLEHPLFGDDRGSVVMVDRSGRKTTLSAGWGSVQGVSWSASGQEVWFTAARTGVSRSLYAVTAPGRERLVASTPSRMTLQDVSRDGRVLFDASRSSLGFVALLPGVPRDRDLSGLDFSYGPILSEDGRTVVFTAHGEGGGPGYSVYLRKTDGSAPVRLGEGSAMALSPDGKWVLTCLIRSTPTRIMLLPTGAGEARTFPKDEIEHAAGPFGAFFPDGKRILFVGHERGRPSRLFVQDLAGGAPLPVTAEGVDRAVLSADGRSLVIVTPEGLALAALAGGPSRPIPGARPGDVPLRFASDARTLFVRPGSRELPARVFRLDVATGRREVWREFTPADPSGITRVEAVAISDDGQAVLFSYARVLSDLFLAEGLR